MREGSQLVCRPDGHGHRGPPQAALDACSALKAADACNFTLGDKAVQGTCNAKPDGSQLVCRPDGWHGHRGPPQAALDACANLKAADACSFTLDDKPIQGTCGARRDGGQLVCRPDGWHGRRMWRGAR